MLKRARLTDDVGWVGEHHLAALLPDTSALGAQAFADGVCGIIARRAPRPLATIYTYPRDAASLPPTQHMAPAASLLRGHGRHSNGKPLPQANGHANGHSHGHRHANGEGHSHGNGISHNHHSNGNGHSFNSDAAGASSLSVEGALALLDAPAERHASPAPAVERQSAVNQLVQPVIGVEELLTIPMPRWKRFIDIVGALALMLALSPILALAALAIKITSPGPVIFKQRRSGLGGKPFLIYKFRTMVVDAEKQQQELRKLNEQDGPAFKLTNDPRVTRVGQFLRKTSIDELPQLWNILRGEMSLVGPRPLPIAEQEGCEQWQRHRLNVTPGITCIWQVKGRSQVTFAEWVRMDVEYIRRRTIVHDFMILLSTIPSVLLRKGAR